MVCFSGCVQKIAKLKEEDMDSVVTATATQLPTDLAAAACLLEFPVQRKAYNTWQFSAGLGR